MTENKPIIECRDCTNKCSCFYNFLNFRLEQLTSKTQECEELEKKLNYIRDENIHLIESATDEQIDFLALNDYIKTLELKLDQLKAENEQLKEKIEKIKVICRCTKDSIYYGDCPTCDMCEKLYTKGIKHQDIILQIIDEVKE